MFLNKKSKQLAFTLIELLVVIAIIGILTTLAVVALQTSRASARNAKRLADLGQLQTALALYYHDYSRYPEELEDLSSTTLISKYMETIPVAPTPADGNCTINSNNYVYVVSPDKSNYSINTCIGQKINSLEKGAVMLTPSGLGPFIWSCGFNFLDERNNKSYKTVLINNKCWFAENLNIGVLVTVTYQNPVDDNIIDKFCYGNIESGCDVYGGIYTWYEAMDYKSTSVAQGICPNGWHIPENSEWIALQNYLGGQTVAGGKLKESGTSHWQSPNTGATNSVGFSALPAGERGYGGYSVGSVGMRGGFWSTGNNFFYCSNGDEKFIQSGSKYIYGYSVRCIKD